MFGKARAVEKSAALTFLFFERGKDMAQVDMPKSSIGQTPTEPKKKLEKVVKGKVAVKEQSDMQKIASQFLAEDLKTVKDRILTDYLLPMLKNGA